MKKITSVLALVMVLTLGLAACSAAIQDETAPMSDGTMEKEDTMKEDMEKDDGMKEDMDDTTGHGTMNDESMKKDDMSDDKDMEKDDMDKEDAMKDDMDKPMTVMNDGSPAPAFSLMNLDGDTVSLADLSGEKVYVKYWASWCSICLSGLEDIDQLSAEAEGFKVITIVTPGFGGEKSVEDFKEWFAGKGADNLTVLFDVDGKYAREFGVRGFPTSAYIGSDGILVKTAPGHVDNDRIIASFEAIK